MRLLYASLRTHHRKTEQTEDAQRVELQASMLALPALSLWGE
jgi:hypothetical protein